MVMRNLFYLLLTSSIFIVLFLFLRAAFRKKTSMRLQYALWLLVLGKLLLPVPLLESPFSLFTVTQKADFKIQEQAPEMQSFQKNTNSYNDQLKNNGNQNQEIHKKIENNQNQEIENNQNQEIENNHNQEIENNQNQEIENVQNQQNAKTLGKNQNQNKSQIYQNFLHQISDIENSRFFHCCIVIAGIGSCFWGLYFIKVNMRFDRFLHRERMLYEGMNFPLPIYIVAGLPSPCLYGKAIYITPEMTVNEQRLTHMLTHEYCHYRQGDLLWSVLRCLCIVCYWWNPLVWMAARLSKLDCELACDEAVLRRLGAMERIPYGDTLISLIPVKNNKHHYFSIATTMGEGGRSMKKRIERIAQNSKAIGVAGVLLAVLAVVCFVSMSTAKPQQTKNNILTDDSSINNPTEKNPEKEVIQESNTPEQNSTKDIQKYTMKLPKESDYMDIPYLELNKEQKTFQFHVCIVSSYLNYGTYTIEDNILKAVTDDGKYHYQFRKNGEDSYIFMADQSSALENWDDKLRQITPEILDGTEFCLETDGLPVPNESAPDDANQAVFDLDKAISQAIFAYNKERYWKGECAAEGHIQLHKTETNEAEIDSSSSQNKGNNSLITVYALTMYGQYEFQNGNFVKGGGSGVIPAVIIFSYSDQQGYLLEDYQEPMEGADYQESIEMLFPETLWKDCLSPSEEIRNNLKEQAYVKRYLQEIGREAAIGEYSDFEYLLLTDAGIRVEVSNKLCDLGKEYSNYPDFIGNIERVEDNIRYVYEMALDKEKNEIIYTKKEYNTGEVAEQHIFDASTGELQQKKLPLIQQKTTEKAVPTQIFTEEVNTLEGISMEIISYDTVSAVVTINNTTQKEITFGEYYDLQILQDGKWYSLSYLIDNYAFDDIAYITTQNIPTQWSVDWTLFHGVLSAGRYRIVKPISVEQDLGDFAEYYLAVEFTL